MKVIMTSSNLPVGKVTTQDMDFDPIYRRQLVLRRSDNSETDFIVSMNGPIKDSSCVYPPADIYLCAISLFGNGIDIAYYVPGTFDSFDALTNALKQIRVEIDNLDGEVYYLNTPNYSGFPLQINSSFGVEHVNRSEKIIKGEFENLMEELEKRRKYQERNGNSK